MPNEQYAAGIAKVNGYSDLRFFEDGANAAIMPLLYTFAIVYDINMYGYDDRWCYKSYEDAKSALDAWDGTGEPQGWHRHQKTGRRRDESGIETINF